jgi:hypothetical protein
MTPCGQRAVLVITRTVDGTSTSVARSRVELSCQLPSGHTGAHVDTAHAERWEAKPGHMPTLLRHEDEEGGTE